jgi:hypothetical protein
MMMTATKTLPWSQHSTSDWESGFCVWGEGRGEENRVEFSRMMEERGTAKTLVGSEWKIGFCLEKGRGNL